LRSYKAADGGICLPQGEGQCALSSLEWAHVKITQKIRKIYIMNVVIFGIGIHGMRDIMSYIRKLMVTLQ
jgi:hypothetical protein